MAAPSAPAAPEPPETRRPGAPPGGTGVGGRRTALIYGAVAAVVSLALIGGVLVATRGSRDERGTQAGEVFLEPTGFTGEHPFTEDLDTSAAPPPVRLVSGSATPESPGPTDVRSVQGVAPGLYGGTRDEAACDAARLVEFLRSDPDKAAAWAAVQGIAPSAIPEFVDGLTPLVLRADTRVTNHGYRDGRATPIQSILEAGTAVLVDDLGIPRVKCGCGNPLAAPQAQAQGVRYTGKRWPGFRPAGVLVVVNTVRVRVTSFVVVDLARPGYFTRPIGTPPPGVSPEDGEIRIDTFCDLFPEDCRPPSLVPGGAETSRPGEPALGTGDVQVTLRWNSTADLDLAVTDPGGETVDFNNPASSSGGRLDVDSNAGCNDVTTTPVENVFWPRGGSPDGEYTITVTYFQECPDGEGAHSFELTVLMGGVPVAVQPVRASESDPSFTLLVGGGSTDPSAVVRAQTGSLDPGGQFVVTATKEGSLPGGQPPGPPHSFRAGPVGPDAKFVPGRISLNWLWAFDDTVTEGYELTVEPGGETFVLPGEMTHLTLPGLEPGAEYTFTLVAFNQYGKSPPVTTTGTTGDPEEEAPPEEPAPAAKPETLEEYCDRMFPPPPTVPAENPRWALCMHDPTSSGAVDPGSLPMPVPATG